MPAWCHNFLRVSSENREQLYEFIEKVRAREGTEYLGAVARELAENWGPTRVFPVDNISFGDNWVKYKYNTRYAPAIEWIKVAAEMYPDFEFSLEYFMEFSYEGWFKAHGEDWEEYIKRSDIGSFLPEETLNSAEEDPVRQAQDSNSISMKSISDQ